MRSWGHVIGLSWIAIVGCFVQSASAQRAPFSATPAVTNLTGPNVAARPVQTGMTPYGVAAPAGSSTMNGVRATVPLSMAGSGITNPVMPSTSPGFDPYNSRPAYQNPLGGLFGSPAPATVYPPNNPYPATTGYPAQGFPTTGFPSTGLPTTNPTYAPSQVMPPSGGLFGSTQGVYPGQTYTPQGYPVTGYGGGLPSTSPMPSTLNPGIPGGGLSGSIGAYNGGLGSVYPPSMVPGTTPPSLFPTPMFGGQGGLFGSTPNPYGFGGTGAIAPGATYPYGTWNPQGTFLGTVPGSQQFIRFFQGPRFRHAFIYGNNHADSLMINDSDVSLAFAIPNFLFSTQPVYILPSFSLHNWDGPNGTAADLPPIAYSAFLDTGWQSDPLRILGAELGVRVGVFSDFNTYNTDSLRIMGRGLARVRLTPTATLKGGIVYLDRNELEWLPAAGILWQPNPATRFDVFFPEPKLSHYLSTVGNFDTWWYVSGYYGGGAWTIKRANGTTDSVDINDIRLNIGFEWGRNDQLRDGRRVGFLEAGYVFNRELIYKATPANNLDLQDSFVIRAGLGY